MVISRKFQLQVGTYYYLKNRDIYGNITDFGFCTTKIKNMNKKF